MPQYLYHEEINLNDETVMYITKEKMDLLLRPTPFHCDHLLKICCILKGKGVWIIAGTRYNFSAGDIFLLNNSSLRALESIDKNEMFLMMTMEFEPRFIWNYQKSFLSSDTLKIFFNKKGDYTPKIPKDQLLAQILSDNFKQADYEITERLPHYQQLVIINSLNCLLLLNRFFDIQNNGLRVTNAPWHHSEAFNHVIDYIEENLSGNLSLKKLSSMASLNPSYFSRIFREYNGLAISTYIMKLKVQKSISYLTGTQKSIVEISDLCGFSSISNFYKAFRHITGKTPNQYRKVDKQLPR